MIVSGEAVFQRKKVAAAFESPRGSTPLENVSVPENAAFRVETDKKRILKEPRNGNNETSVGKFQDIPKAVNPTFILSDCSRPAVSSSC